MCLRAFISKVRVIIRVTKHPDTPWHVRCIGACSLAYLFSPIQAIPSFIPVLGQLDDILVLCLGFKLMSNMIPDAVLLQCAAELNDANHGVHVRAASED